MKRLFLSLISLCLLLGTSQLSSQITGEEAARLVPGSQTVIPGKYSKVPDYIRLRDDEVVVYQQFELWLSQHFSLPKNNGFKLLSNEPDNLGMVHYRLQQTIHGIPVEGTMYIVHTKGGAIQSMNGQVLTDNDFSGPSAKIKESKALSVALKRIGAKQYKWQIPEQEKTLKETTGNLKASYYPKGEKVYISENGDLKSKRVRLAYKFDIYAANPVSRNYVFVDATTGKILRVVNRIENFNVNATAMTQYSGARTIVTDNYGGGYRLRETSRGNGVYTFNLSKGTNQNAAVDFVNGSTTWNNVNSNLDQYATDAHLAAEGTYDFYKANFNRNSLDNAGLQLVSFVHYSQSFENAFWDGNAMNYGDGYAPDGVHPFTSLDIGGHEITHGLTQLTAQLNYQNEPGGLNESFSDCMGVSIRQFVKQSAAVDYYIGDEVIQGGALRSMSNPKQFGQPDTYMGTYWVQAGGADNGGVHTNSGVQNYWYYLVSHGGTGVNDNNQSFNITGIGMEKAQAITYRNLTVYLTPNSQYSDARTYSIQSALDLYGTCSPEVQVVTNAWHAVGVGAAFSGLVDAAFNASSKTFCAPPATVYFSNTSSNGTSYQWSFGDGSHSSATNPAHTYTSYGDYTVKLYATSACGVDSVVKTALIHVSNNPPVASNQNICGGQSATLTATSSTGTINWYSTPSGGSPVATGNTYHTPVLNSSTTYYAETDIVASINTCGPHGNSFGTGGFYPDTFQHALIFNCNSAQTLLTVDVYAGSAGNRTIFLTDNAQQVLQTATVHLIQGKNTVFLNFPLPVATDLHLAISNKVDLYRQQSGAVYPYYSTDSTVIITNSDAGQPGYYYYFYNWTLQGQECISNRVPVEVNVAGSPGTFTYNTNGNTANFTAAASGLSSYKWNFGDGTSSSAENPSHTYLGPGSYLVTLVQFYGACNDTVTQIITLGTTVINEITGLQNFVVFPNPASSVIDLSVITEQSDDWKLCVNNMVGQTLLNRDIHLTSGRNSFSLDISSYAAGVYFISLQNGNVLEKRRFIKSS